MESRYENLKSKPTAFRSFAGFDVKEFQILLAAFTPMSPPVSQSEEK